MGKDTRVDESNFRYAVRTIETHAGGMNARVITGGLPEIMGETMREKINFFRSHYDFLRTALVCEPRGQDSLVAAVLTEPCLPEADYGIFFIQQPGYIDMCGHGTIATSTALIMSGLVDMREPVTEITFDTAAGLVKASADIRDGKVTGVSFTNVPSFVVRKGLRTLFRGKEIEYDIAYGGDCYAMISVEQIGLEISPGTVHDLMEIELEIFPQMYYETKEDLLRSGDPLLEGIQFYSGSPIEGCDARNVVLNGRLIDRSPCGTGTCARLALLYCDEKIGLGKEFVNESFLGSTFTGSIIGLTESYGHQAVIPQVRGRGFITGISTFLIDPEDPFAFGINL